MVYRVKIINFVFSKPNFGRKWFVDIAIGQTVLVFKFNELFNVFRQRKLSREVRWIYGTQQSWSTLRGSRKDKVKCLQCKNTDNKTEKEPSGYEDTDAEKQWRSKEDKEEESKVLQAIARMEKVLQEVREDQLSMRQTVEFLCQQYDTVVKEQKETKKGIQGNGKEDV